MYVRLPTAIGTKGDTNRYYKRAIISSHFLLGTRNFTTITRVAISVESVIIIFYSKICGFIPYIFFFFVHVEMFYSCEAMQTKAFCICLWRFYLVTKIHLLNYSTWKYLPLRRRRRITTRPRAQKNPSDFYISIKRSRDTPIADFPPFYSFTQRFLYRDVNEEKTSYVCSTLLTYRATKRCNKNLQTNFAIMLFATSAFRQRHRYAFTPYRHPYTYKSRVLTSKGRRSSARTRVRKNKNAIR